MTNIALAASAGLIAAVLVWGLTYWVRRGLIHWRVYDAPNERSLHGDLKPRGGGLAILLVVLPAWVIVSKTVPTSYALWPVLMGTIVLAAVSFIDDVRGLPPAPRFMVQACAVLGALYVFDAGLVFQGWLPLWADRLLAGVLWLWFVNLFNFMDGIDGISGVELISVALGLGLVAALTGQVAGEAVLPWILAGAAAGFLVWNWAPSKIFLGDAGSISLGYLLGWLLLIAAAQGHWAAALILPAYYFGDATWTLLRRITRGQTPWHPHREHAYQAAVQRGASHGAVARYVAGANALFLLCTVASLAGYPWLGLLAAASVAALLLTRFKMW